MLKTMGAIAHGAAALAIVFSMAVGGETDADLQRKPELVDLLADRAVATCELQQSELDQIPYIERLEDVLAQTESHALDYFKENGIVICLDKRLQGQQGSPGGGGKAGAIYYPDEKVVSLWDNGKDPAQTSIFELDATTRGDRYLDSFTHILDGKGSLSQLSGPLFAHSYRGGVGFYRQTKYDWHNEAEQNMHAVFDAQPFLRDAPVAAVR